MGNPAINNNRNYGIDLLRLVSMYMVVILHITGWGGAIAAASLSAKWLLVLLHTAADCAVDCYAIISGYVCFREKDDPINYGKYIRFWVPVFVYSFGITVVTAIARPGFITATEIGLSMIPITYNVYWYATAYTGLFFLMPWINRCIRASSKRQLSLFVLVLFSVFSVYNTVAHILDDVFRFELGNGLFLLTMLYFIGAWMKKCDIIPKIKSVYAGLTAVFCILITWANSVYMSDFGVFKIKNLLLRYESFTVVLTAFCYVVLFAKMKIGRTGRKLISFFAPASFGVYLIHCQFQVWHGLMKNAFSWIANREIWQIPLLVLGSAFCVFAVCIVIERTRLFLFKSFKINTLIDIAVQKVNLKVKSFVSNISFKDNGEIPLKQTRNHGIDLLRIVSMYMVVILHVIGYGGAIFNSDGLSHSIILFIKVAAFCAVDCYAIISGYVCFKQKEEPLNYGKYLKFWLPVFVYSFGVTLAAFLLRPAVISGAEIGISLFPITAHFYWYASAYTGLFFLMPWINKCIRSASKRQYSLFIILLILLFIVYENFSYIFSDAFRMSGGDGTLSLVVLYFIGAWMKKCEIITKIKSVYAAFTIVLCVIITYTDGVCFNNIGDLNFEKMFFNYSSVTVILSAFCYVVLFAKMKIGRTGKKLISFFAPAAFGVYLIHCQPVIWEGLFKDAFAFIGEKSPAAVPLYVLGSAFGIFAVCIIIDRTRIFFFKMFKIDYLTDLAAEKINSKINGFAEKFKV